jgi:hypothetical protein
MEKAIDIITKIIVFITGVSTVMLNIRYGNLERSVELNQKEVNLQIALSNKTKDSIDFDRKHRFLIYDKVYTAVESKDKNKLDLAVILVTQMLPDDEYQGSLFKVLQAQDLKPETQKMVDSNIAAIDTFNSNEHFKQESIKSFATVKKSGATKHDYLIDVFYLDSKPELRSQASAFERMLTQNGFDARVRRLSNVINARKGYQIFYNQIRVEQGNERENEFGKEIAKIGNNKFEVTNVSQSSPGYISVFIVQ